MSDGKIITPGFRQGPLPSKKQLLNETDMRMASFDQALRNMGNVLNNLLQKTGMLEYSMDVNTRHNDLMLLTLRDVIISKKLVTEEEWEQTLTQNADMLAKQYDDEFNKKNQLQHVDRAIVKDDIVNISFAGILDGNIVPNTESKNYMLQVGKGELLQDMEDSLIGKMKNDEYETEVKFPSDYQSKELKGQTITFKIKVLSVKEKIKEVEAPK